MREEYTARDDEPLVSHVLSSGKEEKIVRNAEVCDPFHLYLFTDVLAKCLGVELGGPRMPELVI